MIRLLRVEFRKFFARDITRLFGLILLGVVVLAGVGSFLSTNPATEAEERDIDGKIRKLRENLESQITECRKPDRTSYESVVASFEEQGAQINEEFDQSLRRQYLRERSRRECLRRFRPAGQANDLRLHFGGAILSSLEIIILPMTVFPLVLGATLIGAEWSSGSITTLLTWQPRRVRLFSAKVLAIGLSTAVGFLLVGGLMAAALLPAAFLRGTFVGMDRWWLEEAIDLVWRGVTISVLAGLLSFSIASIFRSTIVAVGGLFGYLVIAERILTAVTQDLRGWLISNNLFIAALPEAGGTSLIPGRSIEEAIALLAAYVFGLLLISGFLFWRRDVAGSS